MIDNQRRLEIMHDIDNVVESKDVCGHTAFLTARDNSRCLHAGGGGGGGGRRPEGRGGDRGAEGRRGDTRDGRGGATRHWEVGSP